MLVKERIKRIGLGEIKDRSYVVYWMQNAQRTEYNHALEYAIEMSNKLGKPLIVYFGLTDGYPEANERHYAFMLEGLLEVRERLLERRIRFLVRQISPEEGALELVPDSALIITEKAYLRHERDWRAKVAEAADCAMVEVETNLLVPVEEASFKEEYAASTIRKKINSRVAAFSQELKERVPVLSSDELELPYEEYSISDTDQALAGLNIDRTVGRIGGIRGGTAEAKKRLKQFLENKLAYYTTLRNDPAGDYSSGLSPYLHFGQISPVFIAREALRYPGPCSEAFLEELLVRRELAFNFVYYNQMYDRYECLPDWARASLAKHAADERVPSYSLEALEESRTHDPYWNAAQDELRFGGSMHNYMRMYWGKKILEWSPGPEEAFQRALYLNNKYALDGRDPNSFTGVAWCFGKHDRPWKERPVFGYIRYMNDKGLERKFKMQPYLDKVQLVRQDG